MFICHGNICRSPMAEFVLKDLVHKIGKEREFFIASSATSSEEIWGGVGNPIYPPAQRELRRHNIPFTDHRATKLLPSDYEKYDMFICMDSANMHNAKRILLGDPQNKLEKLLGLKDISDPWYSGDFTTTFTEIEQGCKELLQRILKNG
ncbi:MAG: low molecular weight protein-tyrosine-phosphatase [Synergistaceae bacterium]|nr:low molecular weight protein-tyrosine-phosphatase [Synergistaceae bacterium]